jgi:hypothetical protein
MPKTFSSIFQQCPVTFVSFKIMSGSDFIPNLPPKRSTTVTLIAPAPLVGHDIADATRFSHTAPAVPSLGLQEHQVSKSWIALLGLNSFKFKNVFMPLAGVLHSRIKFGGSHLHNFNNCVGIFVSPDHPVLVFNFHS